jgi:hypothetical protein
MCLVHKTVPAAVMCYQCHKPICQACVIVTGTGSFCSMDCNLAHRMFQANKRPPDKRKLAMALMVGVLAVLILGFFVLVHLMAPDQSGLSDLDLIGRFLRWIRGR